MNSNATLSDSYEFASKLKVFIVIVNLFKELWNSNGILSSLGIPLGFQGDTMDSTRNGQWHVGPGWEGGSATLFPYQTPALPQAIPVEFPWNTCGMPKELHGMRVWLASSGLLWPPLASSGLLRPPCRNSI